MLDMLGARIVQQDCSAGFILDGLPRNHEQAQLLDAHLSKVIDPSKLLTLSVARLTLNQSLLIRRISGRQTCPACALVYNIHTRPPRIKDTCDFDGSRLALRNDDREETVIERLRIYEHEVLSIVHHYAEQGNVVEIDGDRNVEQVTHDILATICESPLTELLLDAVLEGSD
jgi:adenylate kinase